MIATVNTRSSLFVSVGIVALMIALFAGTTLAESVQPADAPALPATFDPLKSAHRNMFEPVFGTPFTIQFDADTVMAFYMGTHTATIPSDTYVNARYVLFKYDAIEDPTVQFQSRGGIEGSANPSHVVVFGWQDYKNYYYVYAAESPETRVARVVNGVHETLYRHGSVIWVRDRDKYQDLKVELKKVDGQSVVDTYVNGELAMSYTFEVGEAPPAGRVGIGGWNGAHSAYFKNIKLASE